MRVQLPLLLPGETKVKRDVLALLTTRSIEGVLAVQWLDRAWAYRSLIIGLGRREVLQRFRASRLGALWLLLQPLTTIATFYFVFVVVFKNRWRSPDEATGEFILALFAGLLLYTAFSEIVGRSPQLIASNVNLVKKIVFPLDVLPLASALSAFVSLLLGACIWLVAFLLVRGAIPPATALLAPIFVVPLFLYAVATTWILAAICVYFRDVGQAVPLALQALLFLSPVLYPLDRVPAGPFRLLLLANPLTIPIESLRNACLYGQAPNWMAFGISFAFAVVLAAFAHTFFMRARSGFADVL